MIAFVRGDRPSGVPSFVAAVRACGIPSRRPSVGLIQFDLGSVYADCPHKSIM